MHGFEGFDRPIHFVKTVSTLMLMKRRFSLLRDTSERLSKEDSEEIVWGTHVKN